jgi:hypothetical protein
LFFHISCVFKFLFMHLLKCISLLVSLGVFLGITLLFRAQYPVPTQKGGKKKPHQQQLQNNQI